MADASTFSKIRIGIASPDEIRSWSYGEVKKPETINYRTFKPERDGLFCERIFGPVKDWECHCGRYKKVKFKGIICERCGVEVTRSKVRRERMGHIELAAPVCHIWYLKGVPSPLALILDISPRPLEKVLYFASYIVTFVDRPRINAAITDIRSAVREEVEAITEEKAGIEERLLMEFNRDIAEHQTPPEDPEVAEGWEPWDDETIAQKRTYVMERARQEEKDAGDRMEELTHSAGGSLTLLEKIEKRQLITEEQFRAIERLLETLTRRLGGNWDDVIRAGLGGAAVKELLQEVDLEKLSRELRNEIANTQGPKRVRAIKRLEVSEAFVASRARPEWMILDCVPVISPELRPMVQLDGGRFATSDLNDLYRRIINRNNRLKKITEIRAPESIVNHEKRLLQEAVDALIDNGRRTRPVVGSNNRALKSLSDMLKGKEGRFRKNLLGKRVDYSGRSVIVVGPHLKLHQCGLPKEMALELFKPFVMKTLVERGYTGNIKTAKRMIDKMKPEVWDALEEVIREHPVLLNRAPTLHRLGIQAFEPVLVDGKAIQVHPLVCHAFNADFDGDQMAVHVPLSAYAQAEARILMLSSHNLFSPANGGPIVAPVQDIILGAYYLTMLRDLHDGEQPRDYVFASPAEAMLAYHTGELDLHEPISVRLQHRLGIGADAEVRTEVVGRNGKNGHGADGRTDTSGYTTAGRLIFNQILPERLQYTDRYLLRTINKRALSEVVSDVYETHGKECCINFLDDLKEIGFRYATQAGVTIAMTDMDVPGRRDAIIHNAEGEVTKINRQYQRGLISQAERKSKVLDLWLSASEQVADAIKEGIEQYNPIYIITDSGARGSWKQFTQLSGMRGLMTDPFGNLIEDLPIKSNFHEGLTVLEFFVSTHGARKGMADTALRTADAGYLTRRLVDVAQDVIVRDIDCGTQHGITVQEILESGEVLEKLSERVKGRYPVTDIVNPITGELIVEANTDISDTAARSLDDIRVISDDIVTVSGSKLVAHKGDAMTNAKAEALVGRSVRRAGAARKDKPAERVQDISSSMRVTVRSVLTCELRQGVCAKCYGRDLATGRLVDIGVATGIIAAQSIGEPGTQLTMRTFHTGGVAGKYLTSVANVKEKRQSTLRELHEDIRSGVVQLSNEEVVSRGHKGQRLNELHEDVRSGRVSIEGDPETKKYEREWARSVQAVLKVLEDQVHGLLRVVELFEARKPKGQAIITELGGRVDSIETRGLRNVIIHTKQELNDELAHQGLGTDAVSAEDILDESGEPIVKAGQSITDKELRKIVAMGIKIVALRKVFLVPYRGELEVEVGEEIRPGDRLTEGPLDPHKVLELQGTRGVQDYLVREIQSVYKGQGVDINDKHIEVIVRQMLRKRKVRHPGDSRFLPGQYVDKFVFEDENTRVRNQSVPGQEATADWVLLGITDASLATESFLSAASFQKTTRVLTEAAVRGKKDELVGLKENVIIGRLIPAGTGLPSYRSLELATPDGSPLIVEPARRSDERTLPLIEDDDDDVPLLGRTASRPDPLPLDAFREIDTLSEESESPDEDRDAEDVDADSLDSVTASFFGAIPTDDDVIPDEVEETNTEDMDVG